jgi:protein polybromo-1
MIRAVKKEDGTQLCEVFIRAPKRRQEPNYYEIVTNPIDLLRVQQKLKTDSYEDIDDLTNDMELLVNNAKAFYKPESIEYKDACALWDVYNTNKAKLIESLNEDSTPVAMSDPQKPRRIGRPRKSTTIDDDQVSENSSENNDYDPYEELFASIMTAMDPIDENRALHTMFQLLPSKKHYPDYYAVIDHPIDLKFIANKIQTNAYSSLNDMEKDILQMVKNAQIFNEPGSQIYKDAKTLKKIFAARKLEIETGKYKRPVRRGRPANYSAMCAALKEELETSEEEMDDLDDETQTGPLWQLFDNLYNQSSSGELSFDI